MSRESSIFSTTLFSLLVIVFISEIQARRFLQDCASSCGDIKNIKYPFRLKGDPEGCGHPEFELSCLSNKTILQFGSRNYYVKRISYNESIISVVDLNLANGNCRYPNKSLSASELIEGSGYFGGAFNREYEYEYTNVCFMRCSEKISNPAYRNIPCFSGNQSRVYVNYGGYEVSDLPVSCSLISMVPVHYQYERYPSYETIRKMLDSGFDLGWSVNCNKCMKEGGYCYHKDGTHYVCSNGGSENRNPLFLLKLMFLWFRKYFLRSRFSDYESFFLDYVLPDPYVLWDQSYIGRMYNMGFLLAVFARFICVLFIARFIFCQLVLLVYVIHNYKKKWQTVDNIEKFLHNQQSWMPKRYSYAEIMVITNNFKDKLGQGGFGSVYRGQLRNGCFIAVKVLEKSKFNAEEFINEVSTIGRIHHVNVVQLVGFYSEGSKRGLVYEYMPNGSLDRYLFSKDGNRQSFGWEKLQEIAVGIARGIEYLHRGCDVCILHFDIKPHNILLDHNFIPKVGDFGLAKFYPKENDFVSVSATRGTIGYIAPELISRTFGVVSCKSDVYSFGMLLLEMAGRRRNSFLDATRSSRQYFPSWVYDRINKGGDLELGDVTEIEDVIARKLSMIGLWCIQVKATDRPSMTRVLEMLEASSDDMPMPPKPFFSSSQQNFTREIESDSSKELLISESMEDCSSN